MTSNFMNSLLSGLCFVGAWLVLSAMGFIKIGGAFGMFGGLLIVLAICHLAVDLWKES